MRLLKKISFPIDNDQLQNEPLYQGNFRLGRNIDEDRALEEWISHLPRTLWELGATNISTSEVSNAAHAHPI